MASHTPSEIPHYKLTYFPVRGRGEFIRYIFALADVPYENNLMTMDEWPHHKQDFPFGSLPFLEIDGGKEWVGQSLTIGRYLARRFGFAGKNMLEQAKADMYVEGVHDMVNAGQPFFNAMFLNPESKDAEFEKWKKNTVIPFLDRYTKFLKQNGTGWLVGDSITWADLYLAEQLDRAHNLLDHHHQLLDDYPELKALMERVNNIPEIAERIRSRPPAPM